MTRIRLINLLDDFSIGGVTNGLRILEQRDISALAESRTIAVNPSTLIAPHLDADLILIHFPPRWRGLPFLASLRLRNPGARIVHLEHSYSREWAALHVRSHRRFNRLLQCAFALSDEVVAVSHAQAKWLVEIGAVGAEKLRVIYPYGQDRGLDRVAPLSRKKGKPLVVGSYGRFVEAKGFDTLIKAFKRLDEWDNLHLLLGGFGPDEPQLRKLADGCSRISFAGPVEDHAAFMAQIDVFAAPSRYESFGQIATEAREAGRPMLVSKVGGLPEQASQAGIVVDCTSEEELLQSLKLLRCLPLEAMGAAGRAEVGSCIRSRTEAWVELLLAVTCKTRAGQATPLIAAAC